MAQTVVKGADLADLLGLQAEFASLKPTAGQTYEGWWTPGATGVDIAKRDWTTARAGEGTTAQDTAAARRALGLPEARSSWRPGVTAQGPGMARPEIVVPVNVYIGGEKLREDQRQVATGVVREAMAGAR